MKYTLLLIQILTLIVNKVTQVSLSFWVYDYTKSITIFSFITVLLLLPALFGSFVFAKIPSIINLPKIIGLSNIISSITFFCLWLIFYESNHKLLILVYILFFLLVFTSGFQLVALSSYNSEVFIDKRLIKANAIVEAGIGVSNLISYPIAAIYYNQQKLQMIFFYSTYVYFLAGVICIFLVKYYKRLKLINNDIVNFGYFQGIKYVYTRKELKLLFILVIIYSFFSGGSSNLITILFIERAHHFFGYLLSMIAVGSIFISILQLLYPTILQYLYKLYIVYIPVIFAINITLSYVDSYLIVGILLFCMGGVISIISCTNTILIQQHIPTYRKITLSTYKSVNWLFLGIGQVLIGFCMEYAFSFYFCKGISEPKCLSYFLAGINILALVSYYFVIYFFDFKLLSSLNMVKQNES